jgi:hypothetical protein
MRRVALLACILCGCALAWQPTDSGGVKAGKLAARIPLGIASLGLSELIISKETQRERDWQAAAARRAHREQLTAEVEHWKAAAISASTDADRQLALTLFQAAREDLAAFDQPPPLAPAPAPAPLVIQQPAPRNCNSQVLNGQVFTHCD